MNKLRWDIAKKLFKEDDDCNLLEHLGVDGDWRKLTSDVKQAYYKEACGIIKLIKESGYSITARD